MENLQQVLTVKEAAEIFGVGERTIRYHVIKGNLSYRQPNARLLLIDLDSLNALHLRLYKTPLKTSDVNVHSN